MALQLTKALTDGLRRVVTPTGGVLFALLLAQQALLITSVNTLIEAQAPSEAATAVGLTLPVSSAVAGALLIGAILFSAVYFVVLSRAFARPIPQLSSFPAALYTRRIGRASLTMFVVGIVVSILVTIGFTLLFFPGLFLAACFLFVIFVVGVEDRGSIGALTRSWDLSRGNRLRLGVIVLVTGVGGTLVGIVPVVFQLAGAVVLGDLVTVVANSILFVFVYGIIAAAYRQLTADDGGLGGSNVPSTVNTNRTPEL